MPFLMNTSVYHSFGINPAFGSSSPVCSTFSNPAFAKEKLAQVLNTGELSAFVKPKSKNTTTKVLSTATFKVDLRQSYTVEGDLENFKKNNGPYNLFIKDGRTLVATLELDSKYQPTVLKFDGNLASRSRNDFKTWLQGYGVFFKN